MRIDPLTPKIWRRGIAFLIAFDAVQLAVRTRLRAPLASALLPVPPVVRDLAGSTPLLAGLAIVTGAAMVFFARGRRPVLAGLLALAANRLLLEAFGAVDGVYDETSYHAGSALLGWICGCLYARALGEARESREVDAMAALGAAAMFGATYVNAGLSKLLEGGLSWADSDTIRLLVMSHRPAGGATWSDALRTFAGNSASFAIALSVGTLVIQCGAFLFPWTRRTRAVWGALFLAFHAGIYLVSGIFFIQAVFLSVLFAFPWADLLVRLRILRAPPQAAETPLPPGHVRRMNIAAGAVLAVLALLALAPLRPRAHPIEVLRPPGMAWSRSVAAFGPLATGMEIAGGWKVSALVIEEDKAVITIVRAEQQLVVDVTHRGDAPRGHFDKGGLHILYRDTPLPFAVFRSAGEDIARRFAWAAGGRDLPAAFDDWLREARR
jgi:hypothetical protein